MATALPDITDHFLDDLTHLSRHQAVGTLFQATVIRLADDGKWWLMNRPDAGWSEYGIPFGTLWAIARHYRLRFVSSGSDAHSALVTVEPLPRIGA